MRCVRRRANHGASRVRKNTRVQTQRRLLQRRPLHARIRIRRELPLRRIRVGHASFAPVCLNSLLYKTEKDLEQISRWLGHTADAAKWTKRAEDRKALVNRYLWDAQHGMFFDYDFTKNKISTYRLRLHVLSAVGRPGHARASESRSGKFESHSSAPVGSP